MIRDRIKELRRVNAGALAANPRNWRVHPARQRELLAGFLREIGFADALLARELEDGTLQLIDGHLRQELAPDQEVPVLVLDVSAEEADKLLLSLDPITSLAEENDVMLAGLLEDVGATDERLRELFAAVRGREPRFEIEEPEFVAGESATGFVSHSVSAESEKADRKEVEIRESYQLVVQCADEEKQRELYERLRGEGYNVRVRTL